MRKNGYKILSMVLILMLMATSLAFAALPSDVTGESYEAAVQKLMDRGVITGDTDGLFHPEASLTRAQACAIVVRAMNPPYAELFGTATQSVPDSGFTDMGGHGWALPYINYAVKNGITVGVGNSKFNPTGQVKSAELITFVLRAAGYNDASIGGTWPENYIQKSKDLDLGTGLGTEIPEYINKWMTAQFTFNALDLIDKAQKDQPVTSGIILTGSTYTTGTFDVSISTFDGKALDKNVAVYAYEAKKNYKKDMTLSSKKSDYRMQNFNNYKNVTTPAWYLMSGGKVVQIILPYDVGFTGQVYGLINSKNTALNGAGDAVAGLDTWTAMLELTWLCKKDLAQPTLTPGDGQIYEMATTNGEVRNITTTGGIVKGKRFAEIGTAGTFVEVADASKGLVGLTGPSISYYQVADNASVYVVQSDNTYKAGSLSSIRKGTTVRLYDISDDKEDNVSIVVVKGK
jgi:hypothetical protein